MFSLPSPFSSVYTYTLPLSGFPLPLSLSSLESRDMSQWHQIAHSAGRLMKLAHPLLWFINFYTLPTILMSFFYILAFLYYELKVLEIWTLNSWNFWNHLTMTPFEIPEEWNLWLHIYKNLKHWLFTFIILFIITNHYLAQFCVNTQ